MLFKPSQNLLRSLSASCTLYFIESGEFVKVGLADDVASRMRILQLGNPLPLRLAFRRTIPRALHVQVERAVHAALAEFATGREWFRMPARDAVKIADPIVKKAHAAVQRWAREGVDLGTGRGLSAEEIQEALAQ